MKWQMTLDVYYMIAAGFISLSVAAFTLRRRTAPGAMALIAINLIGALWAWSAALELAATSLRVSVFFLNVSFIGMSGIGVAWFAFAAWYTGRQKLVTRGRLVLLTVIPFVTQVLVWTNSLHHLMFLRLDLVQAGSRLALLKTSGIWWWIDTCYTYALLLGGIALFGHMVIKEYGVYRRQIVALLAGVVVPFVADFFYVISQAATATDLAPAMFAWVGLVLYWGFVRYQLMNVTPVAREFVAEHMGDGLIVTDTDDRVVYLNIAAERVLSVSMAAIAGLPLESVMIDATGLAHIYREAKAQGSGGTREWKYLDRYYEGRVSELPDRRGSARGSILVLRDITDHKATENALTEARSDLEVRVQERTAELAAEKEQLVQLNEVAVEISQCATSKEVTSVGVKLSCEVLGCDTGVLWINSGRGAGRLIGNDDMSSDIMQGLRHFLEDTNAVNRSIESGESLWVDGDTLGLPATASDSRFARIGVVPLFSRRANIGAILLASGDPDFAKSSETSLAAQAIASQIAVALENVRRYEEAQFLAERDSLTRVLNHRGISQRLDQELAKSDRAKSLFGLVMIDVDNFKLFNDAYGHIVGDQVLKKVARILDTSLRRSDVVGRYGGDEFVVLLPDTDAEAAVQLVERVRKALEENPIDVGDGALVPLKMSYGISVFPHDGATVSELLASADTNLYRSKQRGGDFITASGGEDYKAPQSLGSYSILDGLVTTVDKKDHYTRRHSDNVADYAMALASKLGLSPETQRLLRIAGLLHDVGKLGVPDHILRKPANLTDEEFKAIQNHVTLGELIIQGIPNQEEVLVAIGAHHERMDGKGYPRGLSGNNIPLLGRILAVTDCYSAMTTDRPYRKALSVDEAKAELRRSAGTQLDPQLVSVFLQVLEEETLVQQPRVAFASLTSVGK